MIFRALEDAVHQLQLATANLSRQLEQDDAQQGTVNGYKRSSVAGSSKLPEEPQISQAARNDILDAASKIQQLLATPYDFQRQLATSNQLLSCIRWLCYFKVPDFIPEGAAVLFTDLADKTRLPELVLTRICAMASTSGFFCCAGPKRVEHTSISLGYRSPAPLLDTMLFLTETGMPSAYKMVEMTTQSNANESVDDSRTAFQIAHDTDLGFFPYLSKHPHVAKRLASGMKDHSTAAESHLDHLMDGVDWERIGDAHVVDIGGSTGHASIALAKTFPNLTFTVQDLPHVIAQASKQQLDPSIADRVRFEAHSFFEPQPASSSQADIFLFRQCIQNHPHENAVKIIQALVPSLTRTDSILILNNIVLPALGDNTTGLNEQAAVRVRDLFMMQAMGGQERDLEQWKQLLQDADPRLRIVGVQKPAGSILSVIEVRLFVGENGLADL